MNKLAMLLLILTTSCATSAKLEAKMQARVGQNINSLVDELGPPSQTFKKPDGDTMYTWVEQKGSRGVAVGQMVYLKNRYCSVTYTAGEDGIIKSWRHEGNSCKSK